MTTRRDFLKAGAAAAATGIVIRRAHAVQPITAIQNEYSLWTRGPENNGKRCVTTVQVAKVRRERAHTPRQLNTSFDPGGNALREGSRFDIPAKTNALTSDR